MLMSCLYNYNLLFQINLNKFFAILKNRQLFLIFRKVSKVSQTYCG